MQQLETIQRLLSEPGIKARVAEISGISDGTLSRIANGKTANPGILTVQAIQKALDELATEPEPQHAEAV